MKPGCQLRSTSGSMYRKRQQTPAASSAKTQSMVADGRGVSHLSTVGLQHTAKAHTPTKFSGVQSLKRKKEQKILIDVIKNGPMQA